MTIKYVDIGSKFSVYHMVERIEQIRESTVLYNRTTMNQISYQIENATLKDGARTRVFAGFQRMSKFLPQVDRYTRLAKAAESVYVFGVMDADLPEIENITYVPLHAHSQLAKEWFLLSYSDKFASTLATEELSAFGDPDHQRKFRGVWSFDVRMTSSVQEYLAFNVDAPVLKVREEDHNTAAQRKLVSNIMDRMLGKIRQPAGGPSATDTQEQLRIIIDNTLRPATTPGA